MAPWSVLLNCYSARRQLRSYASGRDKRRGYKLLDLCNEREDSIRRPAFLGHVGEKSSTRYSKEEMARFGQAGYFYDELGNVDKKKFYNFYLHRTKTRPSKFDDPGDWLGRIDVDVELLPPQFRDRPLDLFADNSRDLPAAQRCLEHYIKSTSSNRSKDEQRAAYSGDQNRPGTKALAWLLRDYDSADLSLNLGFLKALVHCMVAERGEHHIWTWLKAPHIPTVLESQPGHERIAWRGAVLRFLVESQAYWYEGADGINAALRTFEDSCTLSVPYESGWQADPLRVMHQLSGVWISRQLLQKGANSLADVRLYDQFISRLGLWNTTVQRAFARAELLRTHPSRPTAVESLEFLRRYQAAEARPIFLRELFDSWAGFAFLVNNAKALEREGYKEGARWMLDIGLLEMPSYFNPAARHQDLNSQNRFGTTRRPLLHERRQVRAAYLSDATGPRSR
ncbi:unnamed protein product [Zymoseptoria tritici ST99CH_3D7]|uniref:Uncharacterized protein n=2 Tax=Zymoseptoria tritici TaxID=1047171 RepID=A0A1X7S5A3_ZYMT9|nr:unnamed protein product [Zymoseptoria tritici ST99CH_3D7]SMR59301.1 unnamed protein product [Zymoseptoria tritici ST99CH_1E4]